MFLKNMILLSEFDIFFMIGCMNVKKSISSNPLPMPMYLTSDLLDHNHILTTASLGIPNTAKCFYFTISC